MRRNGFRQKLPTKKNLMILTTAVFMVGTGGATVLKAGENPSFCAGCHIIKPYYESWNEGVLLDAKHARHDITCLKCHQRSIPDKMQEGLNFIMENYTLPVQSATVGRDFCLECHSGEGPGNGWDDIKVASNFKNGNPHDSHEGEQRCTLCHNMHQPSQVRCLQCHNFNWTGELDESWK